MKARAMHSATRFRMRVYAWSTPQTIYVNQAWLHDPGRKTEKKSHGIIIIITEQNVKQNKVGRSFRRRLNSFNSRLRHGSIDSWAMWVWHSFTVENVFFFSHPSIIEAFYVTRSPTATTMLLLLHSCDRTTASLCSAAFVPHRSVVHGAKGQMEMNKKKMLSFIFFSFNKDAYIIKPFIVVIRGGLRSNRLFNVNNWKNKN